MIDLCFQLANEDEFCLSVPSDSTIADCKLQLAPFITFPPEEFLVIHDDETLADSTRISNLDLATDDVIYIYREFPDLDTADDPPIPIPQIHPPVVNMTNDYNAKLEALLRCNYPRNSSMLTLQQCNGDLRRAAGILLMGFSYPLQAATGGTRGASRTPFSGLLLQEMGYLENVIHLLEDQKSRLAPWFRYYPEYLVAVLGIDYNAYNLEKFRRRQAKVLPFIGRMEVEMIALPEVLPVFQPERHITKFKGDDAWNFVNLCSWADENVEVRKSLKINPKQLENVVKMFEYDGSSAFGLAQFVRKHPDVLVRECGLDPAQFDIEDVKARRSVGDPRCPVFVPRNAS
jgi:hypothetical protein